MGIGISTFHKHQFPERASAPVLLRPPITVLSMKPRGGTPWLEAEFDDGSGAVTLIWMGRRDIPGVTAGRELEVTGRVSWVDGRRRMYNPYYQLR